ncbi:hypothetical protein Cch01nite_18600 [Cellulomonas chitinilytica]|uniref:Uncharacterized protein n=1 Tax=Cellulomonas chitinilytica TaxID=398759 RepID=A0A919P3W5_9CELL|nr:hypothetical protein [Cellulomonas chitinilytica]GIG21136.1 hypothetical protein Cch01nite_18600 [Cellulomonas chitinilytica]
MSVRLLAIALANLGVLLVAVRALLNATRQRRDARRCLDARRARHPDVGVNELALLEPEEIDVLTVAPSRATVRGTRILDPWSAELPIADHQLPVYANKLRNRARTGDVAAEVAIVVASAFAGVAASDIVRDLADGGQVHQAPLILLTLAVAGAIAAVHVRTAIVGDWKSAASRYRELTIATRAAKLEALRSAAASQGSAAQPQSQRGSTRRSRGLLARLTGKRTRTDAGGAP